MLLDNILVQDSAKSPPFTQFFGVDAKYAKHSKVFGEMCVVVDTDNKVGRTRLIQEYGWCLNGTCHRDIQGGKF